MTKELREKTFSFRISQREYSDLIRISELEDRTPGAILRNLLRKEIMARLNDEPTQQL